MFQQLSARMPQVVFQFMEQNAPRGFHNVSGRYIVEIQHHFYHKPSAITTIIIIMDITELVARGRQWHSGARGHSVVRLQYRRHRARYSGALPKLVDTTAGASCLI